MMFNSPLQSRASAVLRESVGVDRGDEGRDHEERFLFRQPPNDAALCVRSVYALIIRGSRSATRDARVRTIARCCRSRIVASDQVLHSGEE